jgi:hypothetical protein
VLWHFVLSFSDAFHSVALLFCLVSHYFCSFIVPFPLSFFQFSLRLLQYHLAFSILSTSFSCNFILIVSFVSFIVIFIFTSFCF